MDIEPLSISRSKIIAACDRFLSAIVQLTAKYLTGRFSAAKVAAVTVPLSLLITLPLYKGMGERFKILPSRAFAWKVEHPLSPIPWELKDVSRYAGFVAGGASHVDKMELRLALPILGRVSGTGSRTVMVWNPIAGFATFYLLASLASEALLDPVAAALFVLGLAPTFFGSWFFNDFIFGDGVALCLLTVCLAASRWPLLSGLSLFAAAFCDERCVLAAPLLACYIAIRSPDSGSKKRTYLEMALAILCWGGLRWWLARTYGMSTGRTGLMTMDILRYHLGESIPGRLWDVFRASWTLPIYAFLVLAINRRWRTAMVGGGSFALAILPAFLVWDFDRSVIYTFAILPLSLYFLRGDENTSRKWMAAILVLNVLFSAPGKTILRGLFWLH